jgi:putative sigma-54 modulation protein
MDIHIEGIHVTITDALKKHIEEKLEKVFEICNRLSKIDVEVKQENNKVESFKVTGILHLNGLENKAISVENENAYTAINDLQQHMLRQSRKIKEKY